METDTRSFPILILAGYDEKPLKTNKSKNVEESDKKGKQKENLNLPKFGATTDPILVLWR